MIVAHTVAGNSAPNRVIDLSQSSVGDMTDADFFVIIKRVSDGTITNAGFTEADIKSPTEKTIEYNVRVQDFPTAGNYLCDIKVIYPNGEVRVFNDYLWMIARKSNIGVTSS